MKLLVQLDYDLVMESLMLESEGLENLKVLQLICLEQDSGQDGCSNLESIRRVLRYGIGIRNYEPRYYYGRAKEHYGSMSVLPFLIVTNSYAIQISSDLKTAVLHKDSKIVEYLNVVFDRMYHQSLCLMVSIDGFSGAQAKWGEEYIRNVDYSKTYEMCSGLCSVQFWNENLIRKYMNHKLPGYETMVVEYINYASGLYNVKRQGQVTVLMNASFVEDFFRTGIFREYPAIFLNLLFLQWIEKNWSIE